MENSNIKLNKRNIALWTLYDFANSIAIIVFFLYFSQWLVIDKGVSDFWYNMIFTIGSALLLITAPILGGIADRTGRQQKYLNRITILTFTFFFLTSIVTLFFSQKVFLAALFFLIANYLYQFSFVFYNALLHYIAPKQKWGRISGIGQASNWLGQIAGLIITLPLAAGTVYLFGEAGRAQTFLPSTILFLILSLPMLLFFKLKKKENKNVKINLREEYKNQWRKLKEFIDFPGVGLFLLAYFFFNDAIITASNNFPIYLQNVFEVSDSTKSLLLIGILITSALGALLSGLIADKIGLKKTLMIILIGWFILFPLMSLISNFTVFIILAIVMGILFGSVWTVTRATMTFLCPKEKLNFGFSFYTLSERVATLVAPLTWGVIIVMFADAGPLRYRIAMFSMTFFILLGIYFMRKVKIDDRINQPR